MAGKIRLGVGTGERTSPTMTSACPVYGFEFKFRLVAGSEDRSDAVWHAFIDEVERLGLSAGGGAEVEWLHVLTRVGAQATGADRQALVEWGGSQPDIRDAVAGPLIDVNEV